MHTKALIAFNHPFPQAHPGHGNRLRGGVATVRFGRPRCRGCSATGHHRRKALLKHANLQGRKRSKRWLLRLKPPGGAKPQDRRSSLTSSLYPHPRGEHSSPTTAELSRLRLTERANPPQGRAGPSAKLRSASLKPRLSVNNRWTHSRAETRRRLTGRQHPRLGQRTMRRLPLGTTISSTSGKSTRKVPIAKKKLLLRFRARFVSCKYKDLFSIEILQIHKVFCV